MINKRGEEKIVSVYWFIILLLVSTGIIIMVNIFYNSPYDVRLIEAEILSENVANCISEGGKINDNLLFGGIFKEEFRDHFEDHCSLDFNAKNEFEELQYYLEINFSDKKNSRNSLFEIKKGNPNFKGDCDLDSQKHRKLVQCVQREFYSMGDDGKIYVIKIISMVRKTEQNAK